MTDGFEDLDLFFGRVRFTIRMSLDTDMARKFQATFQHPVYIPSSPSAL